MEQRRSIAIFCSLLLVFLLFIPSTASVMGDDEMQASGETWNIISLFGDAQLSNCHSNLYDDDESADYGEERKTSGVLTIDLTCTMDPALDRNLVLKENDRINARFKIELEGEWTNGQGDCNNDCEDLQISLLKGGNTLNKREELKRYPLIAALFVIQLALNLAWPSVFNSERYLLSFCMLIVIIIFTLLYAYLIYKPVPNASKLVWPYIAWVTFAAAINFAYYLKFS